jgi:hypothetical protein
MRVPAFGLSKGAALQHSLGFGSRDPPQTKAGTVGAVLC